MKQNLTELKRSIHGFTIIDGGFDTSSSEMDRAIRTLKGSIDIQHINDSTNYNDQRDIHKTIPMYIMCIFSSDPGTFIKVDFVLDHNTNLYI